MMELHKQGARHLFAAYSKKDLAQSKVTMTRRLDGLKHERQGKEAKLRDLYEELDNLTKFNMAEEAAKLCVDERVAAAEAKGPQLRTGMSPTRGEYARLDTILCT